MTISLRGRKAETGAAAGEVVRVTLQDKDGTVLFEGRCGLTDAPPIALVLCPSTGCLRQRDSVI